MTGDEYHQAWLANTLVCPKCGGRYHNQHVQERRGWCPGGCDAKPVPYLTIEEEKMGGDVRLEHDYYKGCGSDCGVCPYCTLDVCKACGLYEGCLTTECPGGPSFEAYSDELYEGKLDYVGGEWINACSPHAPASVLLKRESKAN